VCIRIHVVEAVDVTKLMGRDAFKIVMLGAIGAWVPSELIIHNVELYVSFEDIFGTHLAAVPSAGSCNRRVTIISKISEVDYVLPIRKKVTVGVAESDVNVGLMSTHSLIRTGSTD